MTQGLGRWYGGHDFHFITCCSEECLVRVNCQEWPTIIRYDASKTHSFEHRE